MSYLIYVILVRRNIVYITSEKYFDKQFELIQQSNCVRNIPEELQFKEVKFARKLPRIENPLPSNPNGASSVPG